MPIDLGQLFGSATGNVPVPLPPVSSVPQAIDAATSPKLANVGGKIPVGFGKTANYAGPEGDDADDADPLEEAEDTYFPGAVDPAESHAATSPEIRPIVEGDEHFGIYLHPADFDAGRWGHEFVPGRHRDIRQPSSLRPLCSTNPTR